MKVGRKTINRVGERNRSNEGCDMKIVEYNNALDIIIEFQDEYKTRVCTTYGGFKKGQVKNPYFKSVYGVGFIGVGKYKILDENGKLTRAYNYWRNMLKRCYDPYFINNNLTYMKTKVYEIWLNFQNFAEWEEQEYYEIEGQTMCLDKDILIKNNKVYSPKTCVFVPQTINMLFVKRDACRGNLPIGCSYHKSIGKIQVRYKKLDKETGKSKLTHIGYFPNTKDGINEAFLSYKYYKEQNIKEVAEYYKDRIPQILYDAMYKYEVEIND